MPLRRLPAFAIYFAAVSCIYMLTLVFRISLEDCHIKAMFNLRMLKHAS